MTPDPGLAPKDQDPVILLALTVLGEARNQPYQGQVAVAQVVRNRMDLKGWSVADTVLKPFQFDCWDSGDPNRAFLEEAIHTQAGNIQPPGLWECCLQAAESALGSPREIDPTGGATHYIRVERWASPAAKSKNPPWFSKRCIDQGITERLIKIGSHVFARTKW
jgi:spore germination cell wall hydrolase CwlJ-like protein